LGASSPLVVGIDARELSGRPTGTGRVLRSLLRHWREGPDHLVLYVDGPAPEDPVLRHPAVRVRSIGDGRTRGLLWQQRLLPEAARADGLSVLFSPAYTCPWHLDVPRVTAVHDLSFFAHPQDFSFRDAMRRRLTVGLSVRASAAVLVCSDFSRREALRFFPDLAERVRHVPLGPDEDLAPPPAREAARARLGVRGPLAIAVGSILNRRCVPELLRAFARLARAHPALQLDLVGENRTEPRRDLVGLADALGVRDRVRFSGFVDEAALADRYAAADVALALSEYEGFGLPAIEACARGVPLVASREPSLGEIFVGAALLVDPRDETAVARAMGRVLAETGLAERLREAGRALASRHSWALTARLSRDVLAEAAAG
jgi:glycosyltransferase involved in cell wall biosynthesis